MRRICFFFEINGIYGYTITLFFLIVLTAICSSMLVMNFKQVEYINTILSSCFRKETYSSKFNAHRKYIKKGTISYQFFLQNNKTFERNFEDLDIVGKILTSKLRLKSRCGDFVNFSSHFWVKTEI